jgi:hypothetical protein
MKDLLAGNLETRQAPRVEIHAWSLPDATDEIRQRVLAIQMRMASSSMNHEYARLQYDEMRSPDRKEDLLEYMHDCRRQYYIDRAEFSGVDPYALADFEADLLRQKQFMMSRYQA